MQLSEYIKPEHWYGGFYELSIEYHPVGNDQRINDALQALCSLPMFNGLWSAREEYQKNYVSLPLSIDENSVSQFYGSLSMQNNKSVGCVISIIRVEGESDWLDIGIPMSMLERFFSVEYSLLNALNPWKREVNDLLVKVAEIIYSKSPFDLAMIEYEVSGYTNQEEIREDDLDKANFILPADLHKKLNVKGKGKELTSGLYLFQY